MPEQSHGGSGWIGGVLLGAITGLTAISFVLAILAPVIFVASVALIAWKGPRLLGGLGYLTGFGLAWAVLTTNATLACLTIDRGPGRWCEPAEGVPTFLAAGLVIFVAGLLASAWAFRRAVQRG